ncbi:hypothetical protein WMF26_20200 [Sorangium sp. So ce185]
MVLFYSDEELACNGCCSSMLDFHEREGRRGRAAPELGAFRELMSDRTAE